MKRFCAELGRLAATGGLLAGAALSSAVSSPAPTADRVVELPPLMVSEQPNWRYLQGPGFEILSLCKDGETIKLAQLQERLAHLLDIVLPEKLRIKCDLPMLVIAYTKSSNQSKEALMEMLRNAGSDSASKAAPPNVRLMPNLRLWDKDQMATLILLPDEFDPTAFILATDYLLFFGQRTHAAFARLVSGGIGGSRTKNKFPG